MIIQKYNSKKTKNTKNKNKNINSVDLLNKKDKINR